MTIRFHKYQGAGNDFVIIDNRNTHYDFTESQIQHLCNRHFGVGSDGLILLEESEKADFAMRFFNPDGSSGMMCGNGGRCIIAYAAAAGLFEKNCIFEAPDGIHKGRMEEDGISLQMLNPTRITTFPDGIYMNTGTSHFVHFVDNLESLDLEAQGRKFRYDLRFEQYNGCNANFVRLENDDSISIRTYERGVEAETLACGTGITAAAIATAIKQNKTDGKHITTVLARGGKLQLCYTKQGNDFSEVFLKGRADFVFLGEITL